jgi:regulatory protein NPR1
LNGIPVDLGKRFFSSCSKVLDRITNDEIELAFLGRDTSTEKKRRFQNLQDVLKKAFSEDKEEFDRQARSFSSLSKTTKAI